MRTTTDPVTPDTTTTPSEEPTTTTPSEEPTTTTPSEEPTTTTPSEEPTTTQEPTTTLVLERGAEVHARVALALAATSDAAELAADPGALPTLIARSVLRSLSQAHRHLADADVMTTGKAVGAARVVDLSAADADRRVVCACGQAFTLAGWPMHLTGADADPGAAHVIVGQLVAAGPRTRRRSVDVLVGRVAEAVDDALAGRDA